MLTMKLRMVNKSQTCHAKACNMEVEAWGCHQNDPNFESLYHAIASINKTPISIENNTQLANFKFTYELVAIIKGEVSRIHANHELALSLSLPRIVFTKGSLKELFVINIVGHTIYKETYIKNIKDKLWVHIVFQPTTYHWR